MSLVWRTGFGYRSFVANMNCRKEILKKVEGANKKAFARSMPFGQRVLFRIKDNKKKLLFLALIVSLGVFYGYHRKLYYSLQRVQPFSKKFDRWVLGIPNKVPDTIKEQDIREVALQRSTQEELLNLYHEYDQKLYYGVGRNMLFSVYSRLGLLKKDDEKRSYWFASGYHKVRNQKIAGVSAREFLRLFEQALEKLRKENSELTEEQFLSNFVGEFKQELQPEQLSQSQLRSIRKTELSKVAPDDWAKEMFVAELLSKDLSSAEKQIDHTVVESGLQGLAVKDRHQITTVKLMEKTIDLNLVKKKLASSTTSTNKLAKYRRSLQTITSEIQQLRREQEALEQQYRQYYGGDIY